MFDAWLIPGDVLGLSGLGLYSGGLFRPSSNGRRTVVRRFVTANRNKRSSTILIELLRKDFSLARHGLDSKDFFMVPNPDNLRNDLHKPNKQPDTPENFLAELFDLAALTGLDGTESVPPDEVRKIHAELVKFRAWEADRYDE